MDDVLLEARAIWFHLAGNTEDDEEETAAGSREIKKKRKGKSKTCVKKKEIDDKGDCKAFEVPNLPRDVIDKAIASMPTRYMPKGSRARFVLSLINWL